MANIFKVVYRKFQRKEKELLIKKTGSTKKDSYERIRSGQSYLYKRNGMESEVFEVRFRDHISRSSLNYAICKSLKRFPYFRTRLLELDGDFYIVRNDVKPVAKRTKRLPVLGHLTQSRRLVEITYYDRSVYLSFHHALCDGRGFIPFMETLIYYYCRRTYGEKAVPEGVRLAGEPLLPGETVDPFMQKYEYNHEKEFISLSRDAYAIPENVASDTGSDYRFEIKIPHTRYMEVCKANNATPVILLSLLMSSAIATLYPDYDKPINANIATDMREALDVPNTYKNCVKSMILSYDRALAARPLSEQATAYRALLQAQRDRDYCRREANNMLGLFDKLDTLDSFEEKQRIMSFFDGMTLNTYIISYVGQLNVGNNAQHIEDIHLYNSGATGLGINMNSCGAYFTVDIKQSFPSDKYVKAFLRKLDETGIPYTATDVIPFLTPGDALVKRKNKRRQSK